jgi:cell division protein FtsZ
LGSPLLDGLSIAGATNVLVNITSGPSLGIREATQATSVIQEEAGDDVEVIFGTVIEEDMEDKLRVTVIATGFDRDKETPAPNDGDDAGSTESADEKGSRRTVPLDEDDPAHRYKGEDNLRQLDTPAYERRSSPQRQKRSEPADQNQNDGGEDEATSNERSNVRRLRADDLNDRQDRDERSRSEEDEDDDDTDTPAFLRKMMD